MFGAERGRKGFKPKECIECHQRVYERDLNQRVVHSVFKEKNCEACHLRHGRLPVKTFIYRSEKKLCGQCHKNYDVELDKLPSVHTPLKGVEGKCLICHNSHGAKEAKLLKEDASQLCLNCHKKVLEEVNMHQPAKTNCLTCHDPHGSKNNFNLKESEYNLCQTCHNYKSETFIKAHGEIKELNKLSCSDCHNPHSGKGKLIRKVFHAPLAKGCSECHKEGKVLDCFSCHKNRDRFIKNF
ncbi:MAG: cytochrome c3 family protein, partial [candidate division WOR-3 bacterium]